MEKKQNFPSHAGLSGKALIASLFIISGILLFARNVGWITYDLFNVVVSWHSLLIILGIYTMTRRHYLSGATLTLIGVYFLIGGLSWLPENSQTIVWPVALIVAGILFFVKARRRERWMKSHMATFSPYVQIIQHEGIVHHYIKYAQTFTIGRSTSSRTMPGLCKVKFDTIDSVSYRKTILQLVTAKAEGLE